MDYLFVYGTLLSSYDEKTSHEHLKKFSNYIGKAQINGKLYMVDYYPGVVPCQEKSIVRGELYQITNEEALFQFLDKFEEYNPADVEHSEYIRTRVTAVLRETKEEVLAWTYAYNQSTDDLELLPKGDFMNEYHK
jgi:gamma-glutamylcyclotransferase (GGCT)/AIG2-like uncharacterized protein YtfP